MLFVRGTKMKNKEKLERTQKLLKEGKLVKEDFDQGYPDEIENIDRMENGRK